MKTAPKPVCASHELKILGDYWTLMIIQILDKGEMRFCEIQRSLNDVNPTTLTNRLKKLESQKLIIRSTETVDKLSVTYKLTQKGQAILPVLHEIKRFAEKFL